MAGGWKIPLLRVFTLLLMLLTGCNTSNPSSFPYLLPFGDVSRTHAKPIGFGYFADFDPHAKRLEVRPEVISVPVRGQQVLIATIFDEEGKPRRKRRVEWIVEGPGSIIEVDESGFFSGRGSKVDNKYAVSYTDFHEHVIDRGNADPVDDFTIGPGQTWCVLTSAVEGLTTVTVYAPEIHDWDKNRLFVKLHFVDAEYLFPKAASVRAGSEYTFSTDIRRFSDRGPVAGYRVRYRVLDGPKAVLQTAGKGSGPVSIGTPNADELEVASAETIALTDTAGRASVKIAQKGIEPGINRVLVEVLKPDDKSSSGYTVIGKGETKIDWQAPEVALRVTAPPFAQPDRDVPVLYSVSNNGAVETQPIVVKTQIPEGLQLVSSEPAVAVQDGNDLLWRLPALKPGKQNSVQAIFRSKDKGTFRTTAFARTSDGIRSESSATFQVAETRLKLSLEGPQVAIVGETLEYQVTLENSGTIPAKQVKIKLQPDKGLEFAGDNPNANVLDTLLPNQPRKISVRMTAKSAGKFNLRVGAIAEGDIAAEPQQIGIDIQQPLISVDVTAPKRAWVGQEVTWKLRVRNFGDVPVSNFVLRAQLPPEVKFRKTTEPGKQTKTGEIEWELGTAPGKQEAVFELTGLCEKLSDSAVLKATLKGEPMVNRDGKWQTVTLNRGDLLTVQGSAGVEILGIPALQMDIFDAADPVDKGKRTTYTIQVKNNGTVAASKVELTTEVPLQMRPVRGTGPAQGRIDGQRVIFPALDSLRAGAVAVYTVEVDAVEAGDARFKASLKSLSLTTPLESEEATRILNKDGNLGPPPPAPIRK